MREKRLSDYFTNQRTRDDCTGASGPAAANQIGFQDLLLQIEDDMTQKGVDKKDILILKRKFEDNESNIIHELYSKHFGHKNL